MRKKVLILCHSDATQFIDICNYNVQLFDKTRYETTVAYLTSAENEATKQRNLAEKLLFLQQNPRNLKLKAISYLIKLCRREKYQIIICHRYKPSYIMLWVALFCRIPVLFFVMHEVGTLSTLHRRLFIRCLKQKNMLLAGVSDAVRNDICRNFPTVPTNEIITFYNRINTSFAEAKLLARIQARKILNLSEDSFVFGNVARLVSDKDHTTLIKAFALIKPNCPQAKLIIIGDGKLEKALKQLVISLDLNEEIIFTDFIPNAASLMKAFDCFVLSSVKEAFGMVLLEAMLAKLPIICSAIQGPIEVIGSSNILVEPRDVNGFAAAMEKIYHASNEQRNHYGDQGYQRLQTHFSIESFRETFWQMPLLQNV